MLRPSTWLVQFRKVPHYSSGPESLKRATVATSLVFTPTNIVNSGYRFPTFYEAFRSERSPIRYLRDDAPGGNPLGDVIRIMSDGVLAVVRTPPQENSR